jgi:hypothetical protein
MYLYYFERILRAATGDPDFALPYWNYSNEANPNARQIPLPYREPADATNALWISQRSAAMNAGGMLSTSAVNFGPAFTFKNFCVSTGSALSFGGQLLAAPNHSAQPHSAFERTPHDDVHVQIGGYMGSFSTAARDPVFWLHHANIDRLWKRWLDQQEGRGHADAAQWLSHKFVFFDVGGARVELTGAQILDTVAQLDYRYDDDPAVPPPNPATPCSAPVAAAERSVMAAGPNAPIVLEGARQKVALKPGAALRAETGGRNLVLTVEGITFDRMPDTIYEIYLNLPEGHGPMPGKHAYRVNAVVAHLQKAGPWQEGALQVTFFPRGPEPPPGVVLARDARPPAKVTIGSLSLTLE